MNRQASRSARRSASHSASRSASPAASRPASWQAILARDTAPFIAGVMLTVLALGSAVSLVQFTYFRPLTYELFLLSMGIGLALSLVAVAANVLLVRGFAWAARGLQGLLLISLLASGPCALFDPSWVHYLITLLLCGAGLGLLRSRRHALMVETLAALRRWRRALASGSPEAFEAWWSRERDRPY